MKVAAMALGIAEFDGAAFTEKIEKIIAHENRKLSFVFFDGNEIIVPWEKRKPIPYSIIGIEKRAGRNICYSIIGKGNGKVHKRKERLQSVEKQA